MSSTADRIWLVEDDVAAQRLDGWEPDAGTVRLDVPGWRRVAGAGPHPAGLVVGRGVRTADLGVAVADLAGRGGWQLAVPAGGLPATDWLAPLGGWSLAGEPERHDGVVVLSLQPAGDGPTVATLGALLHREPARGPRPAPWRLRLADDTARAWFGDLAHGGARPELDVTATDDEAGADGDRPRLQIVTDDRPVPAGAVAVTDDPLRAREDVRLVARPVDLRQFVPTGASPRTATGAPILPVSAGARPEGVADARERAAAVAQGLPDAHATDELAIPGDGLPGPTELMLLRRAVGVLDHPDLHASPGRHARWVLACVAGGVPVLLLSALPDPVAQLLGADLVDALAAATADELADPDLRERRSVLQRRALFARHTSRARLTELADDLGLLAPPPRSVSAVMATNRADFLPLGLAQLGRQTWPRLQVVVVTHGDRPPPGLDALVDEHLPGADVTLRHVESRWTLGDALNVGIEAADGDVVTKFDDDDWYSPAHVDDLVAGLEYGRADIVGKAAEFVHLAGSTTTLRRWGTGGERPSLTLAGGTLAFPRDVWRDLGGFPRVGVGEDQGLIRDVVDAGGVAYRLHPYGYLLHRHGRHAWDVEDAEFRNAAVAVRDGLDHEWTLT